ncbi:MAG: Rieske (2Fe-2S) protein [Candidatus Micrarchaeales archaeon]
MADTKISLKKSDLSESKPVEVVVNGKKIMLVIINNTPYAIENECSHRGGPLNKGILHEYEVECPWHGAKYDVRTGEASPETPWGTGQTKYNVKIDDKGEIWIDV